MIGNKLIFKVVLLSALIVLAGRIMAPFEIGKDQSSQLEASQNLIDGRGLTTTNDLQPAADDITIGPQPKYLTWWPPGFSLIIAALLLSGLSLVAALKITYVVATAIGWFGWAIIISRLLTRPINTRRNSYPVHLILAALLPLFFTQSWSGTDIFLWAFIPYLILALHSQTKHDASLQPLIAAGLGFGMIYSIRYASLFLAGATLIILIQVRFPDYKSSFIRAVIFLASSLPFVLPTVLYSKLNASHAPGLAQLATVSSGSGSMINFVIDQIFRSFPILSNLIFGFPLVEQILYRVEFNPLTYATGAVFIEVLLVLPIVLIKRCKKEGLNAQNDLALSLALTSLSLVGFLIGVSVLVRVILFGIRRYYEPLVFCSVLIFYQIATSQMIRPAITRISRVMVMLFVIYFAVVMPATGLFPSRRGGLVFEVLGYIPSKSTRYHTTSYSVSYPSMVLYTCKEASKRKVQELAASDPSALFFVEEYGYFIYDRYQDGGPVPGKTLRVFPRQEYWLRARTNAHVRVYWVLNKNTNIEFIPSSNQRVVYMDHIEKTKILFSEFPAGHKFGFDYLANLSRQADTRSQ